jgi:hypothetical protein
MERQFYTDDFEQLLREQTDEFRMYPSKRVWYSIYNQMHPGRKWPSIAVSMLLILTLLVVGYWNSNTSSSKTITAVLPPQKNVENNIALNTAVNNLSANTISAVTSNKNSNTAIAAKVNSSITQNTTAGFIITPVISPATAALPVTNGLRNNLNKEKGDASNKTGHQNGKMEIATTIPNVKNTGAVNTISGTTVINNIDEAIINVAGNTQLNAAELNTVIITAPVIDKENLTVNIKEDKAVKINTVAVNKKISTEDKIWIEDYAFHNKSKRKQWQDRTASEIYITPSVGFRRLNPNASPDANTLNSLVSVPNNNLNINESVNQKPASGLEIGAGLVYAAAKNIRLKIGIQANFTNYIINAGATNHPTLTTLMLNDPNSGYPYMEARSSVLSNTSGSNTVKVHNTTYQLAVPIGFALKLAGDNKLEWYAGASIQPTFVFAGKANVISFDRKNYVKDASLIRQWNLNTGIETYIHYKFAGTTLQVGPQFRYQLGSTYSKKYTLNENLYNVGIKVGLLKNF